MGGVDSEAVGSHGRPHSIAVTLPPLAVTLFEVPVPPREGAASAGAMEGRAPRPYQSGGRASRSRNPRPSASGAGAAAPRARESQERIPRRPEAQAREVESRVGPKVIAQEWMIVP